MMDSRQGEVRLKFSGVSEYIYSEKYFDYVFKSH